MRNIKYNINYMCNKKLYSPITDNSFSDNYFFLEIIRRPIVISTKEFILLPVRMNMQKLNKIIWKT